MAITHVSGQTFDTEVVKHQGVVLVDFYAEWCGPCKMVAPILEELAKELSDVKIVKVNVDENQELAGNFSVFSIPTFLIFKNGAVKNQFVGAQSKESFVSEIKKVTDN